MLDRTLYDIVLSYDDKMFIQEAKSPWHRALMMTVLSC